MYGTRNLWLHRAAFRQEIASTKKSPERFDDSSLQTQWLRLAIHSLQQLHFQVKYHFPIQENFGKQIKTCLSLVSQKLNYGELSSSESNTERCVLGGGEL